MTDPVTDAVDDVINQAGNDSEAALEELARAESEETNAAAVLMGVVALPWRWRSDLARRGNDRERESRRQRPDPQRRLPGHGLGINQ